MLSDKSVIDPMRTVALRRKAVRSSTASSNSDVVRGGPARLIFLFVTRACAIRNVPSLPRGCDVPIAVPSPVSASLYEPINVYKPVAPNIGIVDGPFEYLTVGGSKVAAAVHHANDSCAPHEWRPLPPLAD